MKERILVKDKFEKNTDLRGLDHAIVAADDCVIYFNADWLLY